MKLISYYKGVLLIAAIILTACAGRTENVGKENQDDKRIPVILDTDANNELDDQHAIAYLIRNRETFEIPGITVNTTRNGGLIDQHYDEAVRILQLFNLQDSIPVKKGANGTFAEIRPKLSEKDFDGAEAVNFIIQQAKAYKDKGLVLLPIGKLTNIALALEKEPGISDHVRIVWLGSNFPDPGEYNLDNDTSALNYLLNHDVWFEIATVSYGRESGTADILVSLAEIDSVMPGRGPVAEEPITGRHGGEFSNFGDYSIDLFHHIDLYGDPPARSLFDVGAVAIVKNPNWANSRKVTGARYTPDGWVNDPDDKHEIVLWEYFQRDSIVNDLYDALQ